MLLANLFFLFEQQRLRAALGFAGFENSCSPVVRGIGSLDHYAAGGFKYHFRRRWCFRGLRVIVGCLFYIGDIYFSGE